MPLTAKGEKILRAMEETYGSKSKAEQVLYAAKNAGKISGIDDADNPGTSPLSNARPDMSDDDWDKLRSLLDKFFKEESAEKEHREDAFSARVDAAIGKIGIIDSRMRGRI